MGLLGIGGGGVDGGAGGCDIDFPHAHCMQPQTDEFRQWHTTSLTYHIASFLCASSGNLHAKRNNKIKIILIVKNFNRRNSHGHTIYK